MRKRIHNFLSQQISQAIILVLSQSTVPPEIPLEYYSDEILKYTLLACVNHFSERKNKLRASETQILSQLKNDITEGKELTTLEKQLFYNLAKIKPVWGEFFGTDRGELYNTFRALYSWPCFHYNERLYYKSLREQQLNHQLDSQFELISRYNAQMSNTGKLLQKHEDTTHQLAERCAQQFIKIQNLQMELQNAKQTAKAESKTPYPRMDF